MRLTFRSLAAFCIYELAWRIFRHMSGMTHSCELEDFSSQVFENSCDIDCCLGSDAHFILRVVLQKTLDTAAGELHKMIVSRCNSSKYAK